MHKPSKDKHFIKQPWFDGGPKAMKQFIAENLQYPQAALVQRLEGTVTVRFDIDHKGDVVDAKTIGHALGFGCDEEAIRLVKSMKFMVDKPRGLRVIYHKTIQVHFKLPQVVDTNQVTFNYVTINTPAAKEDEQKPNSSTYSYTINIG
ncbi:MAG: TonB family protein [Bacteroidetes bacterium]|nr:TonB family protein [Bacteroidota bacterium]